MLDFNEVEAAYPVSKWHITTEGHAELYWLQF